MMDFENFLTTTNLTLSDRLQARGPTLGEISYALAEITEIKVEIAKSSSLKRNHKLVLISEISPQYTMFP